MELNYLNTLPTGGFNFDNCIRNKAMAEATGMSQPVKTMKTGTTICGIIYEVRKKPIKFRFMNHAAMILLTRIIE